MQENPTNPDPYEAKKIVTETTEPTPVKETTTETSETTVEPVAPVGNDS